MACIRFAQGVWKVRCMMDYKYHIIGEYKTEKEANEAYNIFIVTNKLNRKLK
jgi:hypothetical protein